MTKKAQIKKIINEVLALKSKKYPKGFKPVKTSKEDEEVYGGQVIAAYDAPMEGWDKDNRDMVLIVKKEDGFYVDGYTNFGDFEVKGPFDTLAEAEKQAFQEMEDFIADWED